MAKDFQRLRLIFSKTDGYCHLCHRKLSFSNHGLNGAKGAWHIEHSISRARGGSDHLNNLYPACIICNIEKGTKHTNYVRRKNGVTRAPHSRAKKEAIREDNTAKGVLIGGTIGLIGGPVGAIFGSIIGGIIGNNNSPRT